MKIQKSKITIILIFIAVFFLDWFIIEPEIKQSYLNQDIWKFENNSWKYSVITFLLIYISFLIYKLYNSKYNKAGLTVFLFYLCLPSAFLAFCLNSLTENTTLYFNSIYHKENLKKEYLIQRYDTNKVFQLYDKKDEIIVSKRELDKIDLIRKMGNLKSLYELQNNDTIIINYGIGFLKTKYFK